MDGISWTTIGGVVVDMILISILVTNVYIGQRKGLVGVIFKIASFLVSLIIVFVLIKPVSQIVIDKTDWDENLTVIISEKLAGAVIDEEGNVDEDDESHVSNAVENLVKEKIKDPINQTKADAIEAASQEVSIKIISVGTMIVLYVVARILLMFLRSVFEVLANLPFIRLFNEAGGVIYGVLKGFLIIYIILAIISLASPLISNLGIISAVNKAFFGSRMYNNNILLNLIMGK